MRRYGSNLHGLFCGLLLSACLVVVVEPPVAGAQCPGEGDCCSANGSPGCEDPECCDTVCALMPTCCTDEWTATCASIAENPIVGCGDYCSPCGR